MSSSSVASSASASSGSAAPTGTGCAYLGDRSFDPVASESMSDSSGGGSAGGCRASAKSLHSGTSIRSFNCRRDGKDMDCPRDGSRAP